MRLLLFPLWFANLSFSYQNGNISIGFFSSLHVCVMFTVLFFFNPSFLINPLAMNQLNILRNFFIKELRKCSQSLWESRVATNWHFRVMSYSLCARLFSSSKGYMYVLLCSAVQADAENESLVGSKKNLAFRLIWKLPKSLYALRVKGHTLFTT